MTNGKRIRTDLGQAERLGAACRALRAMHSMTQEDMAASMGITSVTLREIERGNQTAMRYVTEMCGAAGIELADLDWLMDLAVNSRMRLKEGA